ncbi:hypothetical protein PG991_015287 [Apiospora marii]|uniref:Uncharacterized protein n=1 Tax=Apiospora marii TaxID=335849 RepID=A0ABR1R1B3_9PEZI
MFDCLAYAADTRFSELWHTHPTIFGAHYRGNPVVTAACPSPTGTSIYDPSFAELIAIVQELLDAVYRMTSRAIVAALSPDGRRQVLAGAEAVVQHGPGLAGPDELVDAPHLARDGGVLLVPEQVVVGADVGGQVGGVDPVPERLVPAVVEPAQVGRVDAQLPRRAGQDLGDDVHEVAVAGRVGLGRGRVPLEEDGARQRVDDVLAD